MLKTHSRTIGILSCRVRCATQNILSAVPSRQISIHVRTLSSGLNPIVKWNAAIPETLRREHLEARRCYRNGAFTATVVMVRRTLEGVCVEHGISDTPLVKALKRMQDNELIEGRLVEWAQALRVLGNEAAHFTGTRVSLEDAQDALALAEAILNYMYVFTEQFNEFMKRRRPPAGQP